mmetsp:Transcript_6883/g.16882  ORF Transcript_6883/g.16882 Transcript_6883/m.16882 type:complete len:272 (+) Transcript_6883:104-919(+)
MRPRVHLTRWLFLGALSLACLAEDPQAEELETENQLLDSDLMNTIDTGSAILVNTTEEPTKRTLKGKQPDEAHRGRPRPKRFHSDMQAVIQPELEYRPNETETLHESPTPTPTASPTKKPTFEPTMNPTSDPISNPTGGPTASPSASPSMFPPTAAPTPKPTPQPTAAPTPQPTQGPWFCVARRNGNQVLGPYANLSAAKSELNRFAGNSGNRQMICEMTASGAKSDPHTVGGQNQGAGAAGGFQKWWYNWPDIHGMTAMCNGKSTFRAGP